MSFDSVSSGIVRNSIRSAVCIDNAFVEPYSKQETGEDFVTPKKLKESFKKEKCSLDVYKHVDIKKWDEDKNFVLKNRDLLILDWELSGDPPFKYALDILREAVEMPSLPFVIIYTQQPDISLIELNIRSFFGTAHPNFSERKKRYEVFCDTVEENSEIDDLDKLFKSLLEKIKSFVLTPFSQINGQELKKFMNNQFKKDLPSLMKISSDLLAITDTYYLLEFVVFHLENAMVNCNPQTLEVVQIDKMEHTFLINNTLVMIFVKEKVGTEGAEVVIPPEKVYKNFSTNICQRPRNFLALLYLEMKNLYRDNYGVIGNDLYEIDELAFFHHQKNLETQDDFYSFLINCWKNQMSAFNLFYAPKLFFVLKEYKEKNKIDETIEDYKKTKLEYLQKELVKLNYHYSFLQTQRKDKDRIRFGDLFVLSTSEEQRTSDNFVLCVTPNCDCSHPENNKNRFYFVRGRKDSIDKGLEKAEEGFYSFLIIDNKPICLNWETKPFTAFIPKGQNDISIPIKIRHQGNDKFLLYEATQKENYTQRISNEAFSHASRIGIELAKYTSK